MYFLSSVHVCLCVRAGSMYMYACYKYYLALIFMTCIYSVCLYPCTLLTLNCAVQYCSCSSDCWTVQKHEPSGINTPCVCVHVYVHVCVCVCVCCVCVCVCACCVCVCMHRILQAETEYHSVDLCSISLM